MQPFTNRLLYQLSYVGFVFVFFSLHDGAASLSHECRTM